MYIYEAKVDCIFLLLFQLPHLLEKMFVKFIPVWELQCVEPVHCENNDPWELAITFFLVDFCIKEFICDTKDLAVI